MRSEMSGDMSGEIREPPSHSGLVSLLIGRSSWFAASAPSNGWIRAQPGLPIVSSTSLSTAPGARAEVRIDVTTVALDGDTQADFIRVDEGGLVVRVARGSVAISTVAFAHDDRIELVARGVGLQADTAGTYVLGIDAATGRTLAKVHVGQGDLRIGEAGLPLFGGQQASVDTVGPLSQDRRQVESGDFDRWVAGRAEHWNAVSAAQGVPAQTRGAVVVASPGDWHEPGPGTNWNPAVAWPDGQRAAAPNMAPGPAPGWSSGEPPGWIVVPAPFIPLQPMLPVPAPDGQYRGPVPHVQPPPFGSRPPDPFANPPRTYPNPPRAYPTPPRQYPTPPRAWPQNNR